MCFRLIGFNGEELEFNKEEGEGEGEGEGEVGEKEGEGEKEDHWLWSLLSATILFISTISLWCIFSLLAPER